MKKMLFVMTMVLNPVGQPYRLLAVPRYATKRNPETLELLATIKRDAQSLQQLANKVDFALNAKEPFIVGGNFRPIWFTRLASQKLKDASTALVQFLNQEEAQNILPHLNELEAKSFSPYYTIKHDLLSRNDGSTYLNFYGLSKKAQKMLSLSESIRRNVATLQTMPQEIISDEVQPESTVTEIQPESTVTEIQPESTVTKEPISLEEAAQCLAIEPSELASQFPHAHFYRYENQVGNYKEVTLVTTADHNTFVLKKVAPTYPQAYKALAHKQNRPDAYFFNTPSTSDEKSETIGAFEFMGSQGLDPYNNGQLKQLARLGITFTLENDVFDPNAGNFIVKDNTLHYIDVGLTYSNEPTMCFNLLKNINGSVQIALYFLEKTPNPSIKDAHNIVTTIMQAYKQELLNLDSSILNQFKEDYQKSLNYETGFGYTMRLQEEIERNARWIAQDFKKIGNLHDDIEQSILATINSLFDIINQ